MKENVLLATKTNVLIPHQQLPEENLYKSFHEKRNSLRKKASKGQMSDTVARKFKRCLCCFIKVFITFHIREEFTGASEEKTLKCN